MITLNAAEVKAASQGRECEILANLAGIPEDVLDGRHHPCPACGGTDRFRLINESAGSVLCNQCFATDNGDFLSAVAHFKGVPFADALRMVADYLGHRPQPTNGHTAQPTAAKSKNKTRGPLTATYDYRDETGEMVSQVCRYESTDGKTFRQRKPDGSGGWAWKVKGLRIVPYQLPQLLANPKSGVCIVEGEKDADTLRDKKILATCNAGGAGKWKAEHAQFLKGRNIVILPDNDEAGKNHARQVAESLHGIAESVRIVELPDLPDKGDVSDWFDAGGSKNDLLKLIRNAPLWKPEAEPWPELESFEQNNLPTFPTEVLPPVLRKWVEAESVATQTPPALAALLTMGVCSAMIARRLEVIPRVGWREPVNLYVAVLLEPGNRKSAVFSDCVGPMQEIEDCLIEEARPKVARLQSERRQDESRLKRLEKQAAESSDGQARHEAMTLAETLSQQPEPMLPRLLVDDATAEKLAMIMAAQEGRVASMSPEGGVFDLMAGLYSKSGMPQFGIYLQAHSGDNLTTDRVGRESVRIERPALTCAYAIQPEVIEGLAENSAFRGRGLLARFLYAAPASWIGSREIAAPPVPDATREAYRQIVQQLSLVTGEHVLRLNPQAGRLLIAWETEVESMQADGGELEILRDWGGKLVGATLRMAAVLHCVQNGPTGEIDEPTLASAIEIARYLIPHAEAVLSKMSAVSDPSADDARFVLRWIDRHQKTVFTKTEAQQHGKRRFPKATDIDPALNELTRRGYIRSRPVENPGPGRPASPTFDVNPDHTKRELSEKRPVYSENCSPNSEQANLQNIQNRIEETI